MSGYTAYNCTVIGQRYIEKEKPCEDCSLSYNNEHLHIAVVADGHGDPRCFRSNTGSKLACEIALQEMKRFAIALREENVEERLFTRAGVHQLIDNLFCSIVDNWHTQTSEDLAQNPPTNDEYLSAGEECAAIYREGRELAHIYGTTLIAMLLTERFLLVLHQGDGRCVVMHHDGKPDQPVPWDPRCEGRSTSSLCDDDVLSNWRYHLIDLKKDPIVACYAVSDGIEDSFETLDELNAYLCLHACDYTEKGSSEYLEDLQEHFSELTKNGSRDDISIGGIIDADAVSKYIDMYHALHEYYVAKSENRRALERVLSMKRKMAYLKERVDEAQRLYDEACKEEETHFNELGLLNKIIVNLTDKNDIVKENTLKAQSTFINAEAEFNDYSGLRAEYVEKAKKMKKAMDEAQHKLTMLSSSDEILKAESYDSAESYVYSQPSPDEKDCLGEEGSGASDEGTEVTENAADRISDSSSNSNNNKEVD